MGQFASFVHAKPIQSQPVGLMLFGSDQATRDGPTRHQASPQATPARTASPNGDPSEKRERPQRNPGNVSVSPQWGTSGWQRTAVKPDGRRSLRAGLPCGPERGGRRRVISDGLPKESQRKFTLAAQPRQEILHLILAFAFDLLRILGTRLVPRRRIRRSRVVQRAKNFGPNPLQRVCEDVPQLTGITSLPRMLLESHATARRSLTKSLASRSKSRSAARSGAPRPGRSVQWLHSLQLPQPPNCPRASSRSWVASSRRRWAWPNASSRACRARSLACRACAHALSLACRVCSRDSLCFCPG